MHDRIGHPWENRDTIESVLPEADRKLIESGLHKLATELDSLPTEELPGVIMYCETSARPLAYAVSPILTKVYERRGLHKPPGYYFQSFSGDIFDQDARYRKIYGGFNYQEASLIDDEQTFRDIYRDRPEDFEKFMDVRKGNIAKINKKRVLMETRAADIVSQQKQKNLPLNILLIDDYSKIERTTIMEVFRAFEKVDKKVKLIAFAFLSGISYEDPQYLTQEELRENDPAADYPNIKIIIGQDDPKAKRHGDYGPMLTTHGFMYRSPDNPIFGGSKQAEKAIGFKKNESATKTSLSKNRDPQIMRDLQKALQEIGEKVAAEI